MTQEASYGNECPECGADMQLSGGVEAHEEDYWICPDCDYACGFSGDDEYESD